MKGTRESRRSLGAHGPMMALEWMALLRGTSFSQSSIFDLSTFAGVERHKRQYGGSLGGKERGDKRMHRRPLVKQ